jgi:hypothetical protein
MTDDVDYCPLLNKCPETRRDVCYSLEYKDCGFYGRGKIVEEQRQQEKDKGLARKV